MEAFLNLHSYALKQQLQTFEDAKPIIAEIVSAVQWQTDEVKNLRQAVVVSGNVRAGMVDILIQPYFIKIQKQMEDMFKSFDDKVNSLMEQIRLLSTTLKMGSDEPQ